MSDLGCAVKFQRCPAGNQLYLGTSFVQQASQISCRRAAANHYYVAPPEPFQVMMTKAVGKKLWRQTCQIIGDVLEVGDPDGEDHPPRCEGFTGLEYKTESLRQAINARYQLVLELGHHSVSESETVGAEGIE